MADGSTPPPERRPPPPIAATDDWPIQAADAIERAVGAVRDKTTGPAIKVARGIVYGLFSLLVGTAVLVMLAISGVRALDVYLPDAVVGEQHTWVAHVLVGAVFTIAGMVCWSPAQAPPRRLSGRNTRPRPPFTSPPTREAPHERSPQTSTT